MLKSIDKSIEFVLICRIPMENELVTKTVDLMKQTNRVKAMIDLCREEMVTLGQIERNISVN